MNLLFFDIECASVYKTTAKICAFGYVLCDEKFNIITKEDILINPKGKFHLTDGRGTHGLVLPYEYKEFVNYPVFPQVYAKIKGMLEDGENLVFGHSTLNDVKYLDLETNRFRLPSFNFRFSDSQLLYMTYVGDFTKQVGLEEITNKLGVAFTPHRAADDAYATMKIVEALCRKYDCGAVELGEKLAIKKGRIKNHNIIKPDSDAFKAYRTACERAKKERARRRVEFFNHVNRKHFIRSDKLKGMIFTFSRGLEDDIARSVAYVDKIFELGGKYTHKLSGCTVYVCNEGEDSVRTKNAREMSVKIITEKQLAEELND